ncbi:MAG: replicative DNA helicase, partial [Schwartzia sp.]|nr:replicative DNA helicase [Schwartzia sp. (in: firmicutes)]
MAERMPPQSIDAEQSVLGAMLIEKNVISEVAEILTADDFYRESHRLVFDAIVSLYSENEAADFVTVTEYLKKTGNLEKAGGIAFVSSLPNLVPIASNAVYYAKIVREKSQLRGLIRVGTEIVGSAYEDNDDVDTLMDNAEKRLVSVT